ncbi:MAG TPA: rRNA maturation RNase YbeY [Steroidobacteraceae bacterium]|nr:rRNA maturation RNase YbeY [Steroidobacteraceae bacterium]
MRQARTRHPRAPAPAALAVDLVRAAAHWAPAAADIRRWASAALGRRASGSELAVRVVSQPESRRLNARYRGRDRPTNVLSFPVAAPAAAAPGAPRPLGDLVICAAVLRTEAQAQGKPLKDHWAHLVVHGVLHLVGYDHERPGEARRMERREITVLRGFGIANPYRSR